MSQRATAPLPGVGSALSDHVVEALAKQQAANRELKYVFCCDVMLTLCITPSLEPSRQTEDI